MLKTTIRVALLLIIDIPILFRAADDGRRIELGDATQQLMQVSAAASASEDDVDELCVQKEGNKEGKRGERVRGEGGIDSKEETDAAHSRTLFS